MVQYTTMSCGTTHYRAELYTIEGKYDESKSHQATIKYYLNEVENTRGASNRVGVINSLYEFLIEIKSWVYKFPTLLKTALQKLIELQYEPLASPADQLLFNSYYEQLSPIKFTAPIPPQDNEMCVISQVCKDSIEMISLNRYLVDLHNQLDDPIILNYPSFNSDTRDIRIAFVYIGQEIAGYAFMRYNVMDQEHNLFCLCIFEKYQKRGCGRLVLHHFRRTLKTEFTLFSLEETIPFYLRCGGIQIGEDRFKFIPLLDI